MLKSVEQPLSDFASKKLIPLVCSLLGALSCSTDGLFQSASSLFYNLTHLPHSEMGFQTIEHANGARKTDFDGNERYEL